MRIIAGSHRGHRIAAPAGRDTRPTSDRVRENAFNLIGPVDDADVLDLFAGSGAMGLEALSRGAASATFVESEPRRLPDDRGEPRQAAAEGLRPLPGRRRALVAGSGEPTISCSSTRLTASTRTAHAAPAARFCARMGCSSGRPRREPAPEVPGLEQRTSRKYGSARLTLLEL